MTTDDIDSFALRYQMTIDDIDSPALGDYMTIDDIDSPALGDHLTIDDTDSPALGDNMTIWNCTTTEPLHWNSQLLENHVFESIKIWSYLNFIRGNFFQLMYYTCKWTLNVFYTTFKAYKSSLNVFY